MKKIGEPGWRPTEVHPLAALFPMMTDDEIADLAADIKANGLLHNIVVDDSGKLIDGRNRLRACDVAAVEPAFEKLNGHDAAAYIVSANLARRNLTRGQQAMALAMIYPEPEKGGRGRKKERVEETSIVYSAKRLQQARVVLRHSHALAEDVLARRTSLDEALKTVEEEQRAGQSKDEKMAELRANAPDIADLVDDERLSLEAGITELRTRQRRVEEAIDAAKKALVRILDIPVQMAMIKKGIALGGVEILGDIDLEAISDAVSRLPKIIKGEEPA